MDKNRFLIHRTKKNTQFSELVKTKLAVRIEKETMKSEETYLKTVNASNGVKSGDQWLQGF